MNFLKGLYGFLKNFVVVLYNNVVVPGFKMLKNAWKRKLEDEDQGSLKRMVLVVLLLALYVFAPHWSVLISLLASIIVFDFIGAIAKVFIDLSKLYEARYSNI